MLENAQSSREQELINLIAKKKRERYEKIKNILLYTGMILSIISAITYLIITFILVKGFETHIASDKLLVFLFIGAVAGVMINLSLRIQGLDFAKDLADNKNTLKEYLDLIVEDKKTKLYPMWVMFLKTILTDIIIKGGTLVVTMYFTISFVIDGMGDEKYIWLGIANTLMYLGLGFLSLAKAYDYYNEKHIPYLKQKIAQIKLRLKEEEKDESILREAERSLEDNIPGFERPESTGDIQTNE